MLKLSKLQFLKYLCALVLMLASVTAPFWYFRKKGWLS